MSAVLLNAQSLSMHFGGLHALQEVSFAVQAGSITAIIGPNGAGKTTCFNCLTGFYKPTSGTLSLHHGGQQFALHKMPAHQIARRAGLARTFQNIRLFGGMSVLENCLVAQHHDLQKAAGLGFPALLRTPRWQKAERAAIDRACYWLDRLSLLPLADWPAASLPYGQQRRLEIARALCLQPSLLCLDEPAAGLNPQESEELAQTLRILRDKEGLSLLLIEHDMRVVMGISDHIIVLDYGRKIAEGSAQAVQKSDAVIRAYLGEAKDA